MPFVLPMEHEKHIIFSKWEKKTGDCVIPLYDEAVWIHYPHLRPLYNKLDVLTKLGYQCGIHGIMPPKKLFPIISKPIYNLNGDGIGVRVYDIPEKFEYHPGHFWMPLYRGQHVSTDLLIWNKTIMWHASYRGIHLKKDKTKFEYWEYIDFDLPSGVINAVSLLPDNYCGAFNVETIGNNVIEVQCRFTTQFCGFYGDEWFDAMISLYKDGKHTQSVPRPQQSYSIPVWWYTTNVMLPKQPHLVDVRDDSNNIIISPKRIALIQHTNLNEGLKLRNKVYHHLESHDSFYKTKRYDYC